MLRHIALGCALLLGSAQSAFALNCSAYPYTLTNGSTADANQVMADFNLIRNCANANLAASGANADITSLSALSTPLSIAQGGTGGTSAAAALTALGAAASGANADITSLSALSTPLSLAQGGTNATSAAAARTSLAAAKSGANTDITSLGAIGNTGLAAQDTSASFLLIFKPGSVLTANRNFTITTGDAARTLTMSGDATLSGTNTGDQTITLTGDVTGSGTGSFAATIAANAVSNSKLATMAATTIKANLTGGAAVPTDATISSVLDLAGSTQGNIIYRGAATWAALAPGTANYALLTGGAGANPAWGAVGLLGSPNTWTGLQTLSGGADNTPATTPSTTAAGYLGTPVNTQNGTYAVLMTDAGKTILHTSASTHTYTIPANGTTAFPIGTIIEISNASGGGNLTIAITTDTMYWLPSGSTGSRTLAQNGQAFVQKITATTWQITGVGLT